MKRLAHFADLGLTIVSWSRLIVSPRLKSDGRRAAATMTAIASVFGAPPLRAPDRRSAPARRPRWATSVSCAGVS